ncbi:RNA-binding domain-containing protein [Lojkania enalia]|uniref:Multiple RNA-binding domain-containing protein 1 n=1 Tax=Lojkania enalia TaxID=147567 RepID=A0A9P4KGG2_9PLEO|nr:RNA-binding domain-containing protein [Didymosphaeria enalia]
MESSRIFVRGLPPKFTENDLRKHFAKYPVTDVKFFPHRRIGYVGYKTPEDAVKAVKYFNKSFIKMTRIFVEAARPFSDQSLPRSRKQQKLEKSVPKSTEYVPSPKENALKRKRAELDVEQDPKLKEFLEVMQPPSKTKVWANREVENEPSATANTDPIDEVAVPGVESDDEYHVITKKPKTSQVVETSTSLRQPSADRAKPAIEKVEGSSESDGNMEEPQETAKAQAGPVSDTDWLRTHTKRALEIDDEEEENTQVASSNKEVPESQDDSVQSLATNVEQLNASKPNVDNVESDFPSEEDKILETGRLYLRNLSYDVTEDDLRDHFSKYGSLEEAHVPVSSSSGAAKGFAFLQFMEPEHAVKAYTQNDGTIFQGRLLHIISAKAKRDAKLDDFAVSKLPLKKQREIQRKANASSSTFNWNSLYLNSDSIMSTIAERLGISKLELLDPTSSDAAVKQAHAETHLIQETKSYFAQHGVDLEAFKRSSKGDIAILIKNIPHGSKSDEIRQLFEEYGTVKKFLMPPAGLTAIVVFSNSAQAGSAFKSLAYRKIKDSVLFLEKAPKDLFRDGISAPITTPAMPNDTATNKLSATDLLQDVPEPEYTNKATLYIRNLNFSTTTEQLKETFSPLSGFRSARVKTKVDPKRGVLSMGYGFVEFDNAEMATAALRAMDGYNLEGHKLQIKNSHKGVDAAEERRKEDAAKKAAGTKIIIKNLPFESSRKDIRALFAPYGQLRSVRVPKKFDSSSRGFGFAEFTTKREAANAMDALHNTHLLGRRLVLAFAEAETGDPEKELEKMQQKVGAQANKVALQRLTGGSRKKFVVAGNDDLDKF